MVQYCPEVPIRCHKNAVNGNVSVSLQNSAAAVNELSRIKIKKIHQFGIITQICSILNTSDGHLPEVSNLTLKNPHTSAAVSKL